MTALAARFLRLDDRPGWLERALRRQWPLWAMLVALVALRTFAMPDDGRALVDTVRTVVERAVIFACLTLPVLAIAMLHHTGSIRAMGTRGLARLKDPQDVVNVAACLVLLSLSIHTFPSFKILIPQLVPFAWDGWFTDLDRALHFGRDPWLWLQPVLGYGQATVWLDRIYYLWFPVVFVPVAFAAFMPSTSVLRNRVIYAHVGAWWLLGIIMATGLSSVGPIFHPQLTGEDTFAPLVAALEAVPGGLTTLEVRDMLWGHYRGEKVASIGGISAMPSLHNALAVMLVLAARHVGRVLTVLATIFALTIFVGSIHLGWHYAIDGYVAAIAMLAVWKLAGRLAERTTPAA